MSGNFHKQNNNWKMPQSALIEISDRYVRFDPDTTRLLSLPIDSSGSLYARIVAGNESCGP